jgi:hypothetical protein
MSPKLSYREITFLKGKLKINRKFKIKIKWKQLK